MKTRLRDVARRAGVSVSTASQVFAVNPSRPVSLETRRLVLEAAQDLNYQARQTVAGDLAAKRVPWMRKVGLVLEAATYKFSDPFWAPVLDALEAELTKHRYAVAFIVTADTLHDSYQRRLLAEERIGALVHLGPAEPVPDLMALERTVIVEGWEVMRAAGVTLDAVTIEKRWAIYQVVAHLARLGRQRLAFLGPTEDVDDRAAAFPHALSRVHLPYDPSLCIKASWSVDGGYMAANSILDTAARPDAVVCASDEIALGAMKAARERRLTLPVDLAITGFDDLTFAASLHPALTTVRVPKDVLGAVAARRIIERIKDPSLPAVMQTVPTTLVVRASCGEQIEQHHADLVLRTGREDEGQVATDGDGAHAAT